MKQLLLLPLVIGLTACGPRHLSPNLGGIYSASARQENADRNPIIVIPGILGSRLIDEQGRVVWGEFGGGAVDPSTSEGRRLLALPISASGWPRDGVKQDGALEQLKVSLGFDFRFSAYSGMLQAFGVGGYLDSAKTDVNHVDYGPGHYTCFQFGYDWRRSCAENAAELGRFIEEKRRYVQSERLKRKGRSDEVKFDIIAHSMGGLVARYYLMYGDSPLNPSGNIPVTWAGAKHVEKLIMVGTPNDGSIYPIQQVSGGYRLAPFLPEMDAAVIATMPSIYELLPPAQQGAVIDIDSHPIAIETTAAWESLGWGLADPRQDKVLQDLLPDFSTATERRTAALAHLSKLLGNARAFHRAMEAPCNPPPGVELYAFAGDAVSTGSRAQVDVKGKPEIIDWIPGDGSVTRRSMLMDRRTAAEVGERLKSPIRWSNAHFIFSDHIGMTHDPAFVDNVLHLLLERP
jgi:pimeloyl-ACP methyl ester carboxylesterase